MPSVLPLAPSLSVATAGLALCVTVPIHGVMALGWQWVPPQAAGDLVLHVAFLQKAILISIRNRQLSVKPLEVQAARVPMDCSLLPLVLSHTPLICTNLDVTV